tara:strand:+ start:622 stop:822 length:201 start_codon:yes stop_codon:yes gene_type:complete
MIVRTKNRELQYPPNEMTLERLYDEAIEELRPFFKPHLKYGYREEDLHLAAVDLAKKRFLEEQDAD